MRFWKSLLVATPGCLATFSAATLLVGPLLSSPAEADGKPPQFDHAPFLKTAPGFLQQSCSPCHNDRNASGGLNVAPLGQPESLTASRDEWEKVIQKVRTGEMPPKGFPKPKAEAVQQLLSTVRGVLDQIDAQVPADPGRVTARRLNRNEYANTIRDLLGVDFRADKNFPTDDSGHGFDNIGDVLTISPILMEKYLTAAERIAARAIGADPLPAKPLEFEYHAKDKKIRRPDPSSIEATHRVEWDAEYVIRFGLPGERDANAQPVMMGFWMDGKLLHQMPVETKPSKLVYFNPYSEEEMRLFLPEGDHVFRVGFLNDEFIKTLPKESHYKSKVNKYLDSMRFIGPFPAKTEKASRKAILVCNPESGEACWTQIMGRLARRAYRRPVTANEVDSLVRFVRLAKADGQSTEQGLQLAIQAMLVSPHFLFRIERDSNPNDPSAVHAISDLELASRLSYFLWSSMPDEPLLQMAEAGKLRQPGALEGQIRRMLADPKAAALADNFAGQWLETRNLDSVKPDPGKFPEWGPELREAMKAETRLFFEHMLRENRPMQEFLSADYTFLNGALAKHYGIEGVEGPEFRRVSVSGQRGGILSHGSVLTVSSYPTRTSPVIRGKYVLQNILGTPPPPPPPDVPTLNEESVGSAASLRAQMEKHRTNAVCASCHNRMDVLGFGLENYDAIGRWRTKDGKFDIDSSGTLPSGKTFTTPAELRKLLTEDLTEFSRCLSEKMLTYALGRGLERYDRRTVDGLVKDVAANGSRFQDLVFAISKSLPFQSRRGEAAKPGEAVKAAEAAKPAQTPRAAETGKGTPTTRTTAKAASNSPKEVAAQ